MCSQRADSISITNINNHNTLLDDVNFAEDSPEFWHFVEGVHRKGEALTQAGLLPLQNLQKMYDSGDDIYLQYCTDGWTAYRKHLTMSGIKGYEKFAGLLSSLGGIRSIMDREIESKFIQKMNSFSSREIHQLNHSKKAYECLSEPFLLDCKKFLQTKFDLSTKNSQSKEQKKLQVQQQFLDLARFDVKVKAEELEENTRLNALRPLHECLRAHWDFFYSGYNLMLRFRERMDVLKTLIDELEEEQKKRTATRRAERRQLEKLTALRAESLEQDAMEKSLQSTHIGSGIRDLDRGVHLTHRTDTPSCEEGYLWVSTNGSSSSSIPLTRSWCVVDQNSISISMPDQLPLVMNLLLCTVKETRENGSHHSFQIISPTRHLTLQTLSRLEMSHWIDCIQHGISHQLKSQLQVHNVESKTMESLAKLVSVPGNNVCADCGSEGPEWVSKNLGILVCQRCSGIHRSLGVHISKIRSLKLDELDDSLLNYINAIGNRISNSIWLSKVPPERSRPTPTSTIDQLAVWITDKYNGVFVEKIHSTQEALDDAIFESVSHKNVYEGLRLIAQGANLKLLNTKQELRTVLHQAVDKGNLLFAEMLLQNDVDVNSVEARGWTPLHYAAYRDNVPILKLLLQRGACVNKLDYQNSDALSLSIEYECVEVEPVLREADVRQRQRHVNHKATSKICNENTLTESTTRSTSSNGDNDAGNSSIGVLRKRFGILFRRADRTSTSIDIATSSYDMLPSAALPVHTHETH